MKSIAWVAVLFIFAVAGCTQKKADDAKDTPATGETKQEVAEKVAEKVKPAEAEKPSPIPEEFAASHILISYQGAQNAKPEVTRTKEEALKRAQEVMQKAKDAPNSFGKLAAEYSDGPTAQRGGNLGVWTKGRMVPEFDTAVSGMKVGEISEPVETMFGYHVIQRNALPPQTKLSGRHLLVAWNGARGAKPKVARTKEEALKRAQELRAKMVANPDGIDALIKAESDGFRAAAGGELGIWMAGRGQHPAIDQSVRDLELNAISEPVETQYGYHLIQRIEPVEPPQFAGSHILIAYKDARRANPELTRTKEEAEKRAKEVLAKVKKNPEKFADLAKEFSDDPTAKAQGGSLGVWTKGRMIPEFDQAVEGMKVGEISGIVETAFGYHIIRREKLPE